MNILVFTSLYPNNVREHLGVFVQERMTHVAKLAGCHVKVVAPVPYFPPIKLGHWWQFSQIKRQEHREGLEVYHPRFGMIPKIGMTLQGIMLFLSVLPTVKAFQRKFDFDLIDAHYVYPDGLAAVLLGRVLNKPVIISARGSDINLFSTFPLIRRWLQYTLHRADRVIAVSQALKDMIIKLGIDEQKISVICNGVDTNKFYPMLQEDARQHLNLPAKRIILAVGNLVAGKGFDLLLKAYHSLLQNDKQDTYLIIIGDGEQFKVLKKMIVSLGLQNRARLVGSIPHEELYLWYSAADLLCLPSHREGWPNVIMEALACGRPVVATAVGGIPEIINSDDFGFLTRIDAEDIAEKLQLALNRSWSAGSISQSVSGHSWTQVANAILDLFETVLSSSREEKR